jgi:hypothetical protein
MHTFSRFVRPYQRSCAAFSTVPVGNQIDAPIRYGWRLIPILAVSARISSVSGRVLLVVRADPDHVCLVGEDHVGPFPSRLGGLEGNLRPPTHLHLDWDATARTASISSWLTSDWPSVNVRWRPLPAVAIVTDLVTRPIAVGVVEASARSRFCNLTSPHWYYGTDAPRGMRVPVAVPIGRAANGVSAGCPGSRGARRR